MGVSICLICKSTVSSFICSDCLHKDIKNWLPRNLSFGFSSFHGRFNNHFHSFGEHSFERCFHCKNRADSSICPFCYIAESYNWLKPKNSKLAKYLYKMIPLGSAWKITEFDGCVWKDGFKPIEERKYSKEEFGICDECGEYSDELILVSGEWVCKECSEYSHKEATV